ncbi:WxL domain-containing protein [Enterococcus sp. OL5]|uniref:WxL domain-containing protein n=1 Tax=Enterococcus sp. OL5 TaxID=2590214 RepID=UPI00112DD005|nr:WxL domain-containing protein [Enterococcus sp. OL5]TPR55159.1 hypothetical protein FJU10_18275 [Enterococcus sp. OL5]
MKKILIVFVLSLVLSTQFLSPVIVIATAIEETTSEAVDEEETQESKSDQEQQEEEPETETPKGADQTIVENSTEPLTKEIIERDAEDQVQRNQRVSSIEAGIIDDWHRDEQIPIATISMELTTAFNGANPGAYNSARVYGISSQFAGFRVRAVDARGNDISAAFFPSIASDHVDFRTRADSSPGNGWVTLEIFGIVSTIDNIDLTAEGYFNFGALTFGGFIANTRGDMVRRDPDVTSSMPLMAKAGILNVSHIDESGNQLAESTQTIARPGDEYTTEALHLDGFHVKKIIGEASGNYIPGTTEVTYVYADNLLEAVAVPQTIPLGGVFSHEQLRGMVKNVTLNNVEVPYDNYEVTIKNQPDTNLVQSQVIQATVKHLDTGSELQIDVPVEVVWGNAIFSKEAATDASTGAITLHISDNEPSLIAVEGYGSTLNSNQVTSRPVYSIYHKHYDNLIHRLSVGTVNQSRRNVVGNWNNNLKNIESSYGDVIGLSVNRFGNASQNYNGANTWISRNENIVREAVGWQEALYMITESGYQLLRVNQLSTNNVVFDANDSTEELQRRIAEFFTFHDDFTDLEEKEITYELVTTDDLIPGESGQAIIKVTQTRDKKYSFSMNYEVDFTVNPGQLELTKITNGNFDFGNIEQSSRQQVVAAKGEHAPTITINDYSNTTQWSMYVSASPFVNTEKQALIGATMTLKGLSVLETVHTWFVVPSKDIVLSQAPQLVGTMSNPNGVYEGEQGTTVIQIGESMNGSLTGVQLTLPSNTPVDRGTYHSVVTWELVGDPTLGGNE